MLNLLVVAQDNAPLQDVGDALEVSVKALAILGLYLYATVRLAHDAFYRRFETTAEEVGHTQATILGRAAIYLLVIVTTALGALAAASLPAVFVLLLAGNAYVAGEIFFWSLQLLQWSAVIIAIRRLHARIGTKYGNSVSVWANLSVAALFLAFELAVISWSIPEDTNDQAIGAAVAATLLFFGIGGLTYVFGRAMAADVAFGKEVSGRILNLRAYRVCVTWWDATTPPTLDIHHPYMFLGQGPQWLVLYDQTRKATIRVPASKAILTTTRLEQLASDIAAIKGESQQPP
jgi:hypothetical protein